MSSETALLKQPLAIANEPVTTAQSLAAERDQFGFSVRLFHHIEDVETIWRALEGQSVESPGQSYDFIKLWIQTRRIASQNQFFVVGYHEDRPVALMPLHRKTVKGVRLYTWFPGANVGAYSPLTDLMSVVAMSADMRKTLWTRMTSHLPPADLMYLRAMPVEVGGVGGIFDSLGTSLEFETLYRSHYSSWAECDQLQRSKSRRKHDRQQGERLDAMGAVRFEDVRAGPETHTIIATMFNQRSARFKAMGIPDTFVRENLVAFYHAAAQPGSGVDVRLHVLRLNGDIVAVRYNVVHGDKMFCLISSMSADLAIQNGSPGKQCLLRVMQTVFDEGFRTFDMGAGFTDEKRHWCNVQIPLRQHYVPLSARGDVVLGAHQLIQRTRVRIKANRTLMGVMRWPGQLWNRVTGTPSNHSSE
ncbi:GNAT family N-acetyltransferase [Devosia sp.]|uniref:GNAT family N-acetyltransferase n=1 Tax=Devosia sp. TaxID=1871048 RepID=UPI003265C042